MTKNTLWWRHYKRLRPLKLVVWDVLNSRSYILSLPQVAYSSPELKYYTTLYNYTTPLNEDRFIIIILNANITTKSKFLSKEYGVVLSITILWLNDNFKKSHLFVELSHHNIIVYIEQNHMGYRLKLFYNFNMSL